MGEVWFPVKEEEEEIRSDLDEIENSLGKKKDNASSSMDL